jgi:signal peptidase II
MVILQSSYSGFLAIETRRRSWQVAPMAVALEKTEDSAPIPRRSYIGFAFVLPAILVALDQLSKWATTRFFDLPMSACATGDPRLTYEVSPIADLSLLCNRGISWGLLQGDSSLKRWVLSAIAFIMVGAMLYVLRRTHDRLGQFSLSLVIAGAIGNVIDRLLFGAVTDMIDFSDIGFNYVFNVADSYITVGVIGMFVSSFLTDRAAKRAAKN